MASSSIDNPPRHLPVQQVPFEQALLQASREAYWRFRALIEHEALRSGRGSSVPRWVALDDPKRFVVGQHSFPWSTFLFGLKKRGKAGGRDRSHWKRWGMLLPFDQLRRDLVAEKGWLVVMDPRTQRVALCLNDEELDLTFNPDTEQFWIEHYREMTQTWHMCSYDGETDYGSVTVPVRPEVLVVGDRPEVARHSFNIVPFVTP